MDDIVNPNDPFRSQPDVVFAADDDPIFIRADAENDQLIVLIDRASPPDCTPGALVPDELWVYDYSGSLVLPSTPSGIAIAPLGTTSDNNCFFDLKELWVADIQVQGGEERMALVAGTLFGSVGCDPLKPLPRGLLVCNLEGTPFFYDDDLTTQAWDPNRQGAPCADWITHGFAHVRVNGRDFVYAAGGSHPDLLQKSLDLRELNVTGVSDPNVGITQTSGPHKLVAGDDLLAIVADPDAPAVGSDYLYLIGQHRSFVVDRASVSTGSVEHASDLMATGRGPAGDAHLMLSSTGEPQLWTLLGGHAPYHFRVTDFTQDLGMPGLEKPDVGDQHYSAGPTDGGALNLFWDSVYTPTFSGVGRWDVSGSQPNPPAYSPPPAATSSYRPAGNPPTETHTVEHIELVDLGSGGSTDWHLLAPTAEGDFHAWQVDPDTRDPLPGAHYQDTPSGYWPFLEKGYGNDVVVGVNPSGFKEILIDYSHKPTGQFGIGRYVLDNPPGAGETWLEAGDWTDEAIEWEDSDQGTILPLVADLSVEGDWLLVAARGGFLVVDWANEMVTDHVYTDPIQVDPPSACEPPDPPCPPTPFPEVRGIERVGDRIFVSLAGKKEPLKADEDYQTAVAMYDFDPVNGLVVDAKMATPEVDPVQILVDGHPFPAMQDDFPGVHSNGGKRLSLTPTPSGTTRLYVGTSNGYVLEIEHDPAFDVMTPLSYWHNGGYFEEIMDTDVAVISNPLGGFAAAGSTPSFTYRVLVSKRAETFAIIQPPDMP